MTPTPNQQVVAGLQQLLKQAAEKGANHRRSAADCRTDADRHDRNAASFEAQASQYRELLRIADPKNAATYAEPDSMPDAREWSRRQARIAGAREVIDFIEAHPEIPSNCLREFTVFPHKGNAAADELAVDELARVMGVSSGRTNPGTHYRATRSFGPGDCVELEAVSCDRTDMAWKEGDPFPDWWPTEQAVQEAAELAGQHEDQADAVAQDQADDFVQDRRADLDPNQDEAEHDASVGDGE